jgi:hypothetical protein
VDVDELSASVRRLVDRVNNWTPSRWAASSAVTGVSRASLVHGLVQRIADAAADAERQPRRLVPHVAPDPVLADQLRVVAADLAVSGAPDAVLAEAADWVREVARSL